MLADFDDDTQEPPIGSALFRVVRAVMFEEAPVPELNALPLAQLRLLWTVHYGSDATMKFFSERLGVSQSTVTQLADRLVRRGLVERRTDDEDRRVVRLHTSLLGREALAKAERQQRRTMTIIWEALTEAQREEALRGLETLAAAAEAMRAAQDRPMAPWRDRGNGTLEDPADGHDQSQSQPVVDLMARRVRGLAPE